MLNYDVGLVLMIQDLDYVSLHLRPSVMRIHDYDLDPDDAVGDDLAVDDDDHPYFFWAMNFFDFQIHVYYFLSWMVVLDLYVLQELLIQKLTGHPWTSTLEASWSHVVNQAVLDCHDYDFRAVYCVC